VFRHRQRPIPQISGVLIGGAALNSERPLIMGYNHPISRKYIIAHFE
jgi:hypothetical protein